MKTNKLMLVAMIISCIGSTAMASTNNQVFSTGHYRDSVEANNSLLVGTDINVTQHNDGKVVENIIVGGNNNTIQHGANNSLTVGISNNNFSANSVVGGNHNTITQADNSVAGGWQNASHSSNTLVFGNTNAINFNSDNSIAGGLGSKLTGKNSFIMGVDAKADGNQTFTFGEGATTETDNTYAIGRNATVTAQDSVAIGNNANATIEKSVAIGSDAKTDTVVGTASATINNKIYNFAGTTPIGTMSIGDTDKERTITNVAAGRVSNTSTDAINGSQLHAVVSEVENNTNGIKMNADAIKELAGVSNNNVTEINSNLNALDNRINANQKEARKGIASVSALAALHSLDYNPDHKVDIMAGVGYYRGNAAVALGVAYRPNENTMFTVGASINGKDTAINAGLSYKVGAKDFEYRSTASMAKDIDDLKAIVNQLVQENETLKNQKK